MHTHTFYQPADNRHRISSLTKICGLSWLLVAGAVMLSCFGSWGPCGPVDIIAGIGFLAIIYGVPISLALSLLALTGSLFRYFRAYTK